MSKSEYSGPSPSIGDRMVVTKDGQVTIFCDPDASEKAHKFVDSVSGPCEVYVYLGWELAYTTDPRKGKVTT